MDFWLKSLRWIIPHLASTSGRVILMVSGLSMIWLDHRRIMRKREPKPLDESTLKARTLKLRNEIQAFLDTVPISYDSISQASRKDDILQSSGLELRVNRLHHGYELRFAEPVTRIFNEFGQRGLWDVILADGMRRQVNNEEWYRTVIARLTKLAERPE